MGSRGRASASTTTCWAGTWTSCTRRSTPRPSCRAASWNACRTARTRTSAAGCEPPAGGSSGGLQGGPPWGPGAHAQRNVVAGLGVRRTFVGSYRRHGRTAWQCYPSALQRAGMAGCCGACVCMCRVPEGAYVYGARAWYEKNAEDARSVDPLEGGPTWASPSWRSSHSPWSQFLCAFFLVELKCDCGGLLESMLVMQRAWMA